MMDISSYGGMAATLYNMALQNRGEPSSTQEVSQTVADNFVSQKELDPLKQQQEYRVTSQTVQEQKREQQEGDKKIEIVETIKTTHRQKLDLWA